MQGCIFQFGLKAGMVALVVWLTMADEVWAQDAGTNKLHIVVRKHRYNSRIQLLDTPAPAPLPTEQEADENSDDDKKLNELSVRPTTVPMPQGPTRRPLFKKEPNRLFPLPPAAQTNAEPDMNAWGWLASEAAESRKYLRETKASETNEPEWTSKTRGTTNTNGANYTETGSLTEYNYKPVLNSTAQTSTVGRIVEDGVVRASERRERKDARAAGAKQEGLDMSGQQNVMPLFTETNESLGLARTRKDDPVANQNFQQTRAIMDEISSRYQLNFNMEDAARQPVATLPVKIEKSKTSDGREQQRSDGNWRSTHLSEIDKGAAGSLSRVPTAGSSSLPDSGMVARPPIVERARITVSASSLIEPPKASQAFGALGGLPGSTAPFSTTPTTRPSASTYTPSGFAPVAPYRSTFESNRLSR